MLRCAVACTWQADRQASRQAGSTQGCGGHSQLRPLLLRPPAGWLDDAALTDRLLQLQLVRSAAAGNSSMLSREPLVVTFEQPGEERLLQNWLAWLQGSGTNVSQVLVVMQQQQQQGISAAIDGAAAAAAVDGAAAGFSMSGVVQGFKGPSVLGLPAASMKSSWWVALSRVHRAACCVAHMLLAGFLACWRPGPMLLAASQLCCAVPCAAVQGFAAAAPRAAPTQQAADTRPAVRHPHTLGPGCSSTCPGSHSSHSSSSNPPRRVLRCSGQSRRIFV